MDMSATTSTPPTTTAKEALAFTIPVFIGQLRNLIAILEKAKAHQQSHATTSTTNLLDARLAADMLPLHFQVRTCTNMARNALVGHADWTFIKFGPKPDDEKDFAGLKGRVEAAIEALQGFELEDVRAVEGQSVEFWTGGASGPGRLMVFKDPVTYLGQFVIPNFWFHASMVYAICRMQGVELGKMDWLTGGGAFGA